MDWMLMPLRKYAQFSGRSQRKEFWMWVLFVVLVSIVASIIDRILGFGHSEVIATPTATAAMWRTSGPAQAIVALAFLIPNISVAVRRLHDIDRTGWWLLAPLAPYIVGIVLMFSAMFSGGGAGVATGGLAAGGLFMLLGFILAIVLLVFYCLDGTRGPNRFGPDPKGPDLERTFA